MNLYRHKDFRKHFKTRILSNKSLVQKFNNRLSMFLENPQNPVLKDHQLTGGKKEFRSFWIAGDVRVLYKVDGDRIVLFDIGSHNQVY